jgi:hypothetical protein
MRIRPRLTPTFSHGQGARASKAHAQMRMLADRCGQELRPRLLADRYRHACSPTDTDTHARRQMRSTDTVTHACHADMLSNRRPGISASRRAGVYVRVRAGGFPAAELAFKLSRELKFTLWIQTSCVGPTKFESESVFYIRCRRVPCGGAGEAAVGRLLVRRGDEEGAWARETCGAGGL